MVITGICRPAANREVRVPMTDVLFSNDELDRLRSVPKRVTNPGARKREKPGGHRQQNFLAESEDGSQFRIYLRQNLNDERDFSCGLALVHKGGRPLSLIRYNGSSHRHGEIHYRCHVHRATAEALAAGGKIDRHAEETDRYSTLESALDCLIQDCGVRSLEVEHVQGDFFDGP